MGHEKLKRLGGELTKKTIKARWLRNIFLATIIVLVIISAVLINSIYLRYDHAAQMTLKSYNTETVNAYFSYYANDDAAFLKAAASYAENYEYRDRTDIWIIDKNGNPIVSSGGYDVSNYDDMPDYYRALSSENGKAIARTKMLWGEPAMAMSCILKNADGEGFGAVRYIISLEDVNRRFYFVTGIIIVSFLLIIMLMFNTGYYFVSSIVNPVKVINQTAKRIATGDFSARITAPHSDDELGELCDTINDMAEQLGETESMKNSFISTVSHEIRTPLTAIKGWGETLYSVAEGEDDVMKKGLGIIISETSRLSGMVEELLDFSRMQNGRMKMNSEVVDIIAEIQQAYIMYQPKASSEGKALSLKLPKEEESFVYGDGARICQVFINILDNAVKYTESGGKIEITVENTKKYVKIIFNDNGCGISKSDLAHVKEKFYKANNEKHGTGIGLAVVDEIVRLHNGILKIESDGSNGTAVTVMLPVYKKEEQS